MNQKGGLFPLIDSILLTNKLQIIEDNQSNKQTNECMNLIYSILVGEIISKMTVSTLVGD